jgi:hypothetical protein
MSGALAEANPSVNLRPYQRDAVESILEHLGEYR